VSSLGSHTALIPFKDIRLKKCIGEGSFGRVYFAVWANHTEVAVKIIGPPSAFAAFDPLAQQQPGGRGTGLAVGAAAATPAATPAGGTGAGGGGGMLVALAASRQEAAAESDEDEVGRCRLTSGLSALAFIA
jgi:serine/threonine protein kinase